MIQQVRILFLIDFPGWAHDHKTDNLKAHLGEAYSIRKAYYDTLQADDLDWADTIVLYFWQQYKILRGRGFADALKRNQHKLLIGICSFIELEGAWREQGLGILNRHAQRVFIHNQMLLGEFEPLLKVPVHFTPNGVDTHFFKPTSSLAKGGPLRIGWAGSLSNHGHKRGYYDFILPAVSSLQGIRFQAAAREWQWRDHDAMRSWYQQQDVYLCASRTEGTPNPCLEAAACGLILVTTAVGNMPELIRDGQNGFLVSRNVHAIAAKLAEIRDHQTRFAFVRRQMVKDIDAWDWSIQAQAYRRMFAAHLST